MDKLFISLLGKRLTMQDLFPNYGKTESQANTPVWVDVAMAVGAVALAVGVHMITQNLEKYPEERR